MFITLLLCLAIGAPVVVLNNGVVVRGLDWQQDPSIPPVSSYQGIPFGSVGPRFSNPSPYNWGNTNSFNATQYGPSCWQNQASDDPIPRTFAEECLFLDIYRPSNSDISLPVMLWIYGGSFTSGMSSYYDGSKLAYDGNIIVVSINYRLGTFGWLLTEDVSGNMGFLDQQLAMQWVFNEIGNFGGDPHQITISGESAGAISVSAHLISPGSAGLFRGAIVDSGFFVAYTAAQGTAAGMAVVKATGCENSTNYRECLSAIPAKQLVKTFSAAPGWGMIIDQTNIPADPADLVREGRYNKVPILYGNNQNETTLFICPQYPKGITPTQYSQLLYGTVYNTCPNNATTVTQLIMQKYPPVGNVLKVVNDVGTLFTWVCAAEGGFQTIANFGTPVFHYIFDIVPGWTAKWGPCYGAAHSFELPFVFPPLIIGFQPGYKFTAQERRVSDAMVRDWAQFVTTGAPGFRQSVSPSWAYQNYGDKIYEGSAYRAAECNFLEQVVGTWSPKP